MMKKIKIRRSICLACFVATDIFGAASLSHAQTSTPYIGIEFALGSPTLAPNAVAGEVPQDNYNYVGINPGTGTHGTTSDLNDANGNLTLVTLTHNSNDGFHSKSATNSNNGILLHGEDKSGSGGQLNAPGLTATYTFNDVPNGNYDLIAYIEDDTTGVNANFTVGSTTYYATEESVFQITPPFSLADGTDPNNRPTGNYVEFFNVAPAAGLITFTNTAEGGGNNTSSINGFQLLQDSGPTWTGAGADNNWSTNDNWNAAAPTPPAALNFAGTTQLVTNNDFTPGTTFNGVNFTSSAGAFTLGGNSIALNADLVNNSTAPQTVNLNIALQQTVNFNAAAGNVVVAGNISGSFGLNKIGAQTLTLSGTNTYSGPTTVSGGALVIATAAALPANSAVAIGDSSTMQLAQGIGPVTVSSLTLTGSGSLDISNNHLFINYGSGPDPITSIAAALASGYNNGAWNGPGIISSAAAQTNSAYGVGYADSADPGNPAGLPSGEIEIMYTLLGDANLDGKVNSIDLAILSTNFNHAVSGWDQGDFNFSGKDNSTDFTELAGNFNQAAQNADLAALDAFAAAHGLTVNVPEPASAVIIIPAAATLTLLHRRRA